MTSLLFKVLRTVGVCVTAVHIASEERGVGEGGQVVYWPITGSATGLHSICILILYKSTACSMGLSEMDAQVYNKQGTSLCK